MSEEKVKFIDYQDPISIRVGNAILEKGFGVANTEGYRAELSESSAIGILYRDPDSSLFYSILGKDRIFLGVLYFTAKRHSADTQNWVLEMYGRKYVELVKKLADELAQEFGVSITIRLLSEHPKKERLSIW